MEQMRQRPGSRQHQYHSEGSARPPVQHAPPPAHYTPPSGQFATPPLDSYHGGGGDELDGSQDFMDGGILGLQSFTQDQVDGVQNLARTLMLVVHQYVVAMQKIRL